MYYYSLIDFFKTTETLECFDIGYAHFSPHSNFIFPLKNLLYGDKCLLIIITF